MRRFGEELKSWRSELYTKKYLPHVRPFPRVRELFERLRARGLKLALASSSNPEEVEYTAQLLGVVDLLSGTTSKKDAEFSKPSPEIFRVALKRLGTGGSTLAVGDTPYDILAAHRIALPIAAVLSGGFERALLSKAEFLFDGVEEMEREIDRIDAWFND